MTEDYDWAAALTKAGRRLARTRATEELAKAEVKQLAAEAIAAGVSERTTAELLGINRMSLRAWLGKQSA